MKIVYIENIRLPTEKAHGIQIMKMCEAFAERNNQVELFITDRKDNIDTDSFEYYNVKKNFKIHKIKVPNLLALGRIGFFIQTLIFSEIASWRIASLNPDIIYSRDERILFNFILRFKNLVWESHRGSLNMIVRMIMSRVKKIIVISKGLQELYKLKFPKNSNKIILAPDAVDLSQFAIPFSKEDCRNRLGLPRDKKIALYSGHLYKWKGVDTLAEVAKSFNDNELMVIAGGTPYDLDSFREKYGNNQKILILGQKAYSQIPIYLKSADVLLLPNSAKEILGSVYTSPLKLFEYMASGVPIIASNVRAITEILNDSNATLVSPDNPDMLLNAIQTVFITPEKSRVKAQKAQLDVKGFTWQDRALKITSSL